MYPVKLGFEEAELRINTLLDNKHYAEALLTSVFTLEKTIHRVLLQLVVSAGFPSKHARKLLKSFRGLHKQKDAWPLFDPQHRRLIDLFPTGGDWEIVRVASEKRNKMVHGSQAFDLIDCKNAAIEILRINQLLRNRFKAEYGYDGWTIMRSRKLSTLHTDPKVTIDVSAVEKPLPR